MSRRVYVTNDVTEMTVMLLDFTLEQAARWQWLVKHEYIHGPIVPAKAPWDKAPEAIEQADGTYKCGHFVAAFIPPPRSIKDKPNHRNRPTKYDADHPFDIAVEFDLEPPPFPHFEIALEAQPHPAQVQIPAPAPPIQVPVPVNHPEPLRAIFNALFPPRGG